MYNRILGLSLGGGLIVLASALSDASLELPGKYSLPSTSSMQMDDNGLPQYHYGWCLQLSGLALMLAEVAAVLTMSGYMARFSTVEEMVKSIKTAVVQIISGDFSYESIRTAVNYYCVEQVDS